MFASWTFGKRIAAGFGIAGITLLLIVILAYQSTNTLIGNNQWVDHTYKVRTVLAQLSADLVQAEDTQRNYLLSGDRSDLQPLGTILAKLTPELANLRSLTIDNPEQQRRLDALAPIIQTRTDWLQRTADVRRDQGLDAAVKAVAEGSGSAAMEQAGKIIADVDQAEADLLAERTASAEASARVATSLIIGGGLAGAILVGLIGWFMTRSLSRQIGSAVKHVQSSSAELQSAANQQATGVKEQATSMNEINTTISELLATSRQIAESAQRVSQIADQTTATARSGDGTVERASESITGIRRQVDMVVAHMLDLGKKSQQIGSVLDIVTELAEQTNILSINATIEAVGAGDAGRRFAVVADEIRKLADRVSASAKEIRALIDDVRGSVNTTVMATETGSKAVDAGSKQFGDVAALFRQIATLITTTTEAAREIELSTKQQATAVEQVTIAITNVAQATRETEASAGQTTQTASELASTSRDLLRLVQSAA